MRAEIINQSQQICSRAIHASPRLERCVCVFPQHPVCLPALFNHTMCCSRRSIAVRRNPRCDRCWATCTKGGASVMLIAQDWPWTMRSPFSIQHGSRMSGALVHSEGSVRSHCWRCNCAGFPFWKFQISSSSISGRYLCRYDNYDSGTAWTSAPFIQLQTSWCQQSTDLSKFWMLFVSFLNRAGRY